MNVVPRAHLATGKRLVDFKEATVVPAADILYMPCDVLIPAAIGGVITGMQNVTLLSAISDQVVRDYYYCKCIVVVVVATAIAAAAAAAAACIMAIATCTATGQLIG